jgi:hypothetical protein
LEYSKRRPLDNNSAFAFFKPDNQQFTPNIPAPFARQQHLFQAHRSAFTSVLISWTPQYYYRIRDGRKEMAFSRYPTISLNYNTGLPNLAGSTTQFSHWELSLKHSLTRRLLGTINYGFAAGMFTDTTSMRFQDFRHFRADPLVLSEVWTGEGFRSANYYAHSTTNPYAVFYAHLSSRSLLVKRLPQLALRNFNEQIRFSARFAKGSMPLFELGYGLQQLFFFVDAELFVASGPGLYQQAGLNISIPISRLVP